MTSLPPLAPCSEISRPVSLSEYYHACVASSRFTLEVPREIRLVLRGTGAIGALGWQSALDQVARVHPGTRLRMMGRRRRARWQSDGLPPRLRLIEGENWDVCSDQGAAFLSATPLSLTHGPTIELIVAQGQGDRMLVILRALHAVIDGRGGMLILEEIFRALRGDSLLGCNAGFSDFDFRRSIGKSPYPPKSRPAPWPARQTDCHQTGDMFRRISLGGPKRGLMARAAVAMAAYVHRYSDDPVLLNLPVDMRSDIPGLLTTANFCNMMRLRIDKGTDATAFQLLMREKIAYFAKAGYPDVSDALKNLPMEWLDLLVSRTRRTYRKLKPAATATLSNLGRVDPAAYTAPGFSPGDLVLLPIPGDVFATLACLGDRVEMMIGMPNMLAQNHAIREFADHMQRALA